MIDPYVIYRSTLGEINKEENGYLPIDLFNDYANRSSSDEFTYQKGLLEKPGTAERAMAKDFLFPFNMNAAILSSKGEVKIPKDYVFFDSLRTRYDDGQKLLELGNLTAQLCAAEEDPTINAAVVQEQINKLFTGDDFVSVELFSGDKISERLRSKIKAKRPSYNKPLAERITEAFKIYPTDMASVILYYYRRPLQGKLVMTVDPVTKEQVYDQVNSIPWEWSAESLTNLVERIKLKFATYVREKDLFQMTALEKKPNLS